LKVIIYIQSHSKASLKVSFDTDNTESSARSSWEEAWRPGNLTAAGIMRQPQAQLILQLYLIQWQPGCVMDPITPKYTAATMAGTAAAV
jgi:hypothetical protein